MTSTEIAAASKVMLGTTEAVAMYIGSTLIWPRGEQEHDYSQDYLTFRALEDGTFKFGGNSINYSLNSGVTWVSLAGDTDSPTVNSGQTILWKASLTASFDDGIGTFSSSGEFEVEGNIMSLLYGDNFRGQTSLRSYAYVFSNLFYQCVDLVNAENLVLPATTLADSCYQHMFDSCSSLMIAPKLLATTLADTCYKYMFAFCDSLTTAPELLATTLENESYSHMFMGCSNLSSITCLATDIDAYGTELWLYNVASSGTFIKAASMTSWESGESGIPDGWTVQNYSS